MRHARSRDNDDLDVEAVLDMAYDAAAVVKQAIVRQEAQEKRRRHLRLVRRPAAD